ncbi:ABC transporter ATP-binding protein [Lachnospiraceae bacterium 66-29]
MELKIEGLSRVYGKHKVLHDINFSMHEGIYGLIGKNGAGKSTLMRILATIDFPSNGKVFFNGKDIFSIGEEYRGMIGYMPQDYNIYSGFNAIDFLEYMGALKGMKKQELKLKISDVLEIVNLSDVSHKKIRTYSGGMKRRIGIAQAILNNPDILILDEPTAGLDPSERLNFSNFISNLSRKKIVLLSTHIVSDIEAVAKELIVMNKGKILESGKVEDLIMSNQGKVWEAVLTQEEYQQIQKERKVIHVKQNGNNMTVRYIGERFQTEENREQEPTLEDYYESLWL